MMKNGMPSLCLVYVSWSFVLKLMLWDHHTARVQSFLPGNGGSQSPTRRSLATPAFSAVTTPRHAAAAVDSIEEASRILSEWDRYYNIESVASSSSSSLFVDETNTNKPTSRPSVSDDEVQQMRQQVPAAVKLLNDKATQERQEDSVNGRCMLGICASDTQQGIATLKSWVTTLELPRGLLHGADKDGVPLEIKGGVYIKYNSGGVYSFSDIRKSGLGFDALWKPGDALLEPYDGDYRGVYFQVELLDGEFRQYLVPLDLFDEIPEA